MEFLTSLYNKDLGQNTIKTVRSALSSIISTRDNPAMGENSLVHRLMKDALHIKPSQKYSCIGDVGQLSSYIQGLPAIESLSLKALSYSTATLLCLLTGQIFQTPHAMNTRYTQILPYYHKATSKNYETRYTPMECISRTSPLRKDHTQLFITFQSSYKADSKDTIARWVKETLKLAGVDTTKFYAHS